MAKSRKRQKKKAVRRNNNPKGISRTPTIDVRRRLREEVGFCCPVPGCYNPYLEWHHYNPPWRKKAHHNPEGMIALCTDHHKKADGGAWTVEQLDAMKANCVNRPEDVQGRFEWLRRNILSLSGGIFITSASVISVNVPVIWFEPDENGYLQLNIHYFDVSGKIKLLIRNNNWVIKRDIKDVESPPSGKKLIVKFKNGDFINLEFKEIRSDEELSKILGAVNDHHMNMIKQYLDYPITTLRIAMRINSLRISLDGPDAFINGTPVFGNLNISIEPGLEYPFNGGYYINCKDWIGLEEYKKINKSVLEEFYPEWY